MKNPLLSVIVLGALLLTACGGQSQAAAESVEVEQEAVVEELIVAEAPVVEESAAEESEAEEAVVEEAVVVEEEAVVEESDSDAGTTTYTSPENLFTLEIPSDWTFEEDTTTVENGVVEIYTSPDGYAAVQVVVAEVLADTSAVLKGEYTLDYLKRLNGDDLRVGTDVSLDDGRERLDWWSDANLTSGSAYFDMQDTSLFFFNLAYEEKYEDDYLPVLEGIADSFSY